MPADDPSLVDPDPTTPPSTTTTRSWRSGRGYRHGGPGTASRHDAATLPPVARARRTQDEPDRDETEAP